MPFLIEKISKDKFRLFNINKKVYVKKDFKSKESAIKSGINYMKYRGEKGYVKGNKILDRNKIKTDHRSSRYRQSPKS